MLHLLVDSLHLSRKDSAESLEYLFQFEQLLCQVPFLPRCVSLSLSFQIFPPPAPLLFLHEMREAAISAVEIPLLLLLLLLAHLFAPSFSHRRS